MPEFPLPSGLRREEVRPAGSGPLLSVVRGEPAEATGPAFVLVHGLASNARLWDGVASRLLAAGHPVVAVDQRGHGRSQAPEGGYDNATCADDLAGLAQALELEGEHGPPVVVGQSWGGHVVLTLAARHPGRVGAVGAVDGGWSRLGQRFATFEECWAALAPPSFEGARWGQLSEAISSSHADWPPEGVQGTLANLVQLPDGGVRARLSREHHRQILHSMWADDMAEIWPQVRCPVLLMPAGSAEPRAAQEAARVLASARVRWYQGAHHDVHAQRPGQVAADLLELADALPRPSPDPKGPRS